MRKMIKALSLSMAFLLAFLSTVACSGGNAAPAGGTTPADPSVAQPVVLKFASNTSKRDTEINPSGMAMKAFADAIAERTNGRYTVEFFFDGTLGKSTDEIIGGAQNGAFELFNLSPGSWGSYTKAFAPINIPYLFANEEVAYKFIDGPIGQKMIDDALKDTGIKILTLLPIGFRHITNNRKPIITPDDMKGLKIRTMPDPYQIACMEALGASPTPVAFSELFTALQQKLVDAQENPYINMYTSKVHEVQNYLTETNHNFTVTTISMSQKAFDKLPGDIQAIVAEEAKKSGQLSRDYLKPQEEMVKKEVEGKYLEIQTLTYDQFDAFRKKASTAWDKIQKDIGAEYFTQIQDEITKIEKELGLQ